MDKGIPVYQYSRGKWGFRNGGTYVGRFERRYLPESGTYDDYLFVFELDSLMSDEAFYYWLIRNEPKG